jgi:hypothetical protein
MKYQEDLETAQAPVNGAADAPRLAVANINPATGLATDYLNHFNEAIMLLEMLPGCRDCLADFLSWRPMSYREHFQASRFKGRDLAIAAYEAADPKLRNGLDILAGTMTAVLEAAREKLNDNMSPEAAVRLANRTAEWLKPLVARAGALINGETDAGLHEPMMPQAVADGLMKR